MKGRLQIHTRPGGTRSLIEVCEFRRCAEVRRTVFLRKVRPNEDLRETRVGPVLRAGSSGPRSGSPGTGRMRPTHCRRNLLRFWRGRCVRLLCERLVPRSSKYLESETHSKRAFVDHRSDHRCRCSRSSAVRSSSNFASNGQVVRCDQARPIGSGEKTELALRLYAALAHRPRGDRRVVVRCEIEVVGGCNLDSAGPAGAHGRSEKSGFALASQREADPGQVENPLAHEFEPRVPRGCR